MPVVHQALKTELNNDPLTYGYAPLVAAQDYGALADLINKKRDGTDGEARIDVPRPDITPLELLLIIDTRDFGGSPGVMGGAWFTGILTMPVIPLLTPAGAKNLIREGLDRYIANGQLSQTRLDALALRIGSRAEQLFGVGTVVTPTDVRTALQLP
jgi:hypothetical protein